jgi:hypothetical protein
VVKEAVNDSLANRVPFVLPPEPASALNAVRMRLVPTLLTVAERSLWWCVKEFFQVRQNIREQFCGIFL